MPRELEKIDYLDINTAIGIKKLTNGNVSWFVKHYLINTSATLQHIYHAFDGQLVAPWLIDDIEVAYTSLLTDAGLTIQDLEELSTLNALLNRVATLNALPDAFILEQAPSIARLARFFTWAIEKQLVDIPKKKKSLLI